MTMTSSGVDLTEEEAELLSKLQVAIEALENANEALADAQAKYDVEKVKYDALAKDVENAKVELAKAEAALNAYLNPVPVPSPETKPETKPSVPETKPAGGKNENAITTPAKGEGTNVTSSETKNIAKVSSDGVNTGIDTNTEVYLTTLAVAGIAYLVVKKKEKSEKE